MEPEESANQEAEKLLAIEEYFKKTGDKNQYTDWYENAIQGDLKHFKSRIDEQYNSVVEKFTNNQKPMPYKFLDVSKVLK